MGASESRIRRFVERLAEAVGHVDREEPLRACGPQQIDLFGDALPMPPIKTPAWRELPEETRSTLTSVLARMILKYTQASNDASPSEVELPGGAERCHNAGAVDAAGGVHRGRGCERGQQACQVPKPNSTIDKSTRAAAAVGLLGWHAVRSRKWCKCVACWIAIAS